NADVEILLQRLKKLVMDLEPARLLSNRLDMTLSDAEWVITIEPGQPAIYRNDEGCHEVEVVGHRYTPKGLMLQLRPQKEGSTWLVSANHIEPVNGVTRLVRLNLMTGQLESADVQGFE
ncbi:MAG: hypothetical protein ABIG68_09640, partial [Acidobacteriota bacterium]